MAQEPFASFETGGGAANNVECPTIASANTIAPTAFVTHVTGNTTIKTITLPYAGFSGVLCLIPDAASPWATDATGNIALATTGVQFKALYLVYTPSTGKWYPSY